MQYLYLRDLNGAEASGQLDDFYAIRSLSPSARRFCADLVRGILQKVDEVDEVIRKYAVNYELNRIAAVDRNILRMAIYEMLHCSDIPPVVSINEAIEIAKKYSAEDSGKFVNGVLDRIRTSLPRDARKPQPTR